MVPPAHGRAGALARVRVVAGVSGLRVLWPACSRLWRVRLWRVRLVSEALVSSASVACGCGSGVW